MTGEDMAAMRQKLAIEHKQLMVMYQGVELPFEPNLFDDEYSAHKLKPLLAHEFHMAKIMMAPKVKAVFRVFQRPNIGIFMAIASKATGKFEFDSCPLIRSALPLSAFRVPKKKPTKKPQVEKLVKALIAADTPDSEVIPTAP